MSSVILGPMAGQYLGDMGADVIKIEAPEGDITRSVEPRRSAGMGALFEPRQGAMGYDPVRQAMRRPHRTRDGFLCFPPYVDAHWKRFFEVVGRPDLAADPGFATNNGQQGNIRRVWDELAQLTQRHTNAAWLALPGKTNPIEMPASPPNTRRLPPRLGEHTAEVLREYGFAEGCPPVAL